MHRIRDMGRRNTGRMKMHALGVSPDLLRAVFVMKFWMLLNAIRDIPLDHKVFHIVFESPAGETELLARQAGDGQFFDRVRRRVHERAVQAGRPRTRVRADRAVGDLTEVVHAEERLPRLRIVDSDQRLGAE